MSEISKIYKDYLEATESGERLSKKAVAAVDRFIKLHPKAADDMMDVATEFEESGFRAGYLIGKTK